MLGAFSLVAALACLYRLVNYGDEVFGERGVLVGPQEVTESEPEPAHLAVGGDALCVVIPGIFGWVRYIRLAVALVRFKAGRIVGRSLRGTALSGEIEKCG